MFSYTIFLEVFKSYYKNEFSPPKSLKYSNSYENFDYLQKSDGINILLVFSGASRSFRAFFQQDLGLAKYYNNPYISRHFLGLQTQKNLQKVLKVWKAFEFSS